MTDRRRALIVANSEYQNPVLHRLASPVADSRELAGVLGDPAIGAFEVEILLNETAAKVSNAIEEFFVFSDPRPNDLLLLYFSGHGVTDEEGRLYFATRDTEFVRQSVRRASAVGADFVDGVMRRSRSRRQVLLLDCCHGGAFAEEMRLKGGPLPGLETHFQGKGRLVLTASTSKQFSLEGPDSAAELQPSVYTRILVEGLKSGEADRDGDGLVSLDELHDYLLDGVRTEAPQQTPTKSGYLEGQLYIAHAAVVRPAELPRHVKQALTAPEVFTRHGVIFELGDLLRKGNPGLALSARRALEDLRDNDDSNKIRLAAAECLARESGETSIAIAAGANAGTAYQLPTVEPSAGKMAPSAGSIESPSIEIASDEGVAEADQRTRWRASTSTAVLCAAAITGVTWELISYVLQLLRLYFGVVLNLAVHGLVYWCCAGLAIAFAFRLFTPVLRKKHIVLIAVAWSLVFAARRIGQESFMSSDLQVFQIWSLASGVVANALAGGITGKVLSAGLGSNQSRGALVGAASFGVSFCLSTIMDSLYGAPATGFLMWYFRRRD